MKSIFDGAHPIIAESIGVAAVVVRCVIAIYVFTHDDKQ